MKARTIITAGLAAAALATTATSAQAIPVFVTDATQEGSTLYVGVNYTLPNTALYNPDLYLSVWTGTSPPRRVRALGRHEIQSDYGFNHKTAYLNNITALRPGTYWACVRARAILSDGAVAAHISCRRFRLRGI